MQSYSRAKLHQDLPPEQQAIMPSAGEQGTGTTWIAMHKSPTEVLQNPQLRMATALRLGLTPDAGPRATCALRKGNDGDMCEQSLAKLTHHAFCCKSERARHRPHKSVQCMLSRLIEQSGGYADMDRHVPELYDWVSLPRETVLVMRCAVMDVVGRQIACPWPAVSKW